VARKSCENFGAAEIRLPSAGGEIMACFSPMSREWVKCWFRDFELAPGAASPRREPSSSMHRRFYLATGALEDWQQLVKDCGSPH